MAKEQQYQPLEEHTLGQDAYCRGSRARQWNIVWTILTIFNVILFVGTLVIQLKQPPEGTEAKHQTLLGEVDPNQDLKRVSSYSPVFDKVDLRLSPLLFNGAVTDNSSIFRADPSPEVDAAWDEISTEGFELITVTREEMLKAGKDPHLAVKAPENWALNEASSDDIPGQTTYIAQVDVFHQIHCLNELRKQIHYDYYYAERLGPPEQLSPEHMAHKKHCMHMLLQNLMCHADVDIISHNWVHYKNIHQLGRPEAEPLADFSIVKQCRNFDSLLDWAKKNSVKDLKQRWKDLRTVPDDAIVLDGEGGYF